MTAIIPSPVVQTPTPPDPRPEVRLVALDIDGTLLRTDKRLSRRVVQAVQAAGRRGVRVVLATARPPRSVRQIHRHLGLDTLQINYNGALIHDPLQARHVHHQPLSSKVAWRVVKLARRIDPKAVISVEILDKWYTDHLDESLPTETSRAFMPDFIGPLDAFLHVPVTKLMVLAPPHRLLRIHEAIRARLHGEVGLAVSDEYLLQVVHPRVDKSVALEWVAHQYGVPTANIMAIGDAPNDVGMLRSVGLGVAVGNAWPAARAAADVVVPANDEDGVAYALERYVLNQI